MSFMGSPGACFMGAHSRIGGPTGYVPTLDLTFTGNFAWSAAGVTTAASLLTTTRASTAWAENSAGVWSSFGSNVPRITNKGLLVEEARTNVALWCRDLTQAAWTPTNITAAKDQTGVDGVANSASSITATADNGTILRAITLASSARFETAFVKRLVGSGAVEMTMDNGATWTAVTVTSAWSRVSIPTQTLANPTVGFRLATSGDSVAVDFVQNENGTFATSPIETTTVAITRAADAIVLAPSTLAMIGTTGTLFVEFTAPSRNATAYAFRQLYDSNNDMSMRQLSTNKVNAHVVTGGVVQFSAVSTNAAPAGVTVKAAISYATNNFAYANSLDAAAVTSASGSTPPNGISFNVGSTGGNLFLNNYVRRLAYWNYPLSAEMLLGLTR